MGRSTSTYRARLSVVFDACQRLEQEHGYVNPEMLQEALGLSERMVREYLKDLSNLGVLTYVGGSKYQLNGALVTRIVNELATTDEEDTWFARPTLDLEKVLLHPTHRQVLQQVNPTLRKVKDIFKKMELLYIFPDQLRHELTKLNLKDLYRDKKFPLLDGKIEAIHGERFIENVKTMGVPLLCLPEERQDLVDKFVFVGTAATDHKEHVKFHHFSVITVSMLSASGVVQQFEKGRLKDGQYIQLDYPRLEIMDESVDEGLQSTTEPFYELLSDFPELIFLGRNLAVRYLRTILHFELSLALLKRLQEESLDLSRVVWMHRGGLLPHGFVTGGRTLERLKQRSWQLFQSFQKKCLDHGIVVMGISRIPRDDMFYRLANLSLQLKGIIPRSLERMSDAIFLDQIMKNGDVTCLITRGKERSKPVIPELKEWYWKDHGGVIRIEHLTGTTEEQQLIAERNTLALVLSNLYLKKVGGEPHGEPSVLATALTASRRWLNFLTQQVLTTIQVAAEDLRNKAQQTPFDEWKQNLIPPPDDSP